MVEIATNGLRFLERLQYFLICKTCFDVTHLRQFFQILFLTDEDLSHIRTIVLQIKKYFDLFKILEHVLKADNNRNHRCKGVMTVENYMWMFACCE